MGGLVGMRRRRGQLLVATALMITIIVMGIVVSVYEAQIFFLKTRSLVVREVIGSITADFSRATAVVLAAATRSYFNYSRFYNFTSRFSSLGLSYGARHNFTVARIVANTYLQYWRAAVAEAYASYGLQVDYEIGTLNISQYLGRNRLATDLVKGYWYYPSAASVAYAKLKVNLTNAGFYGWESDVLVGVFLTVYPQPINQSLADNTTTIMINVRVDDGQYYSELLTKGWVEIYYPEKRAGHWTGRWVKARIVDVTYQGYGNYTITFTPYVEELTDPLTGRQFVPLMVVVSDGRGILVEAMTYRYIVFKVYKNTPSTVNTAQSQVVCSRRYSLWGFNGQYGRTRVTGDIGVYTRSYTVVHVQFPNGTTVDYGVPRWRYVEFIINHDSAVHGNAHFVYDTWYNNELYLDNVHVDTLVLPSVTLYNVTILNTYVYFWGLTSRRYVDITFEGGWLDLRSPCTYPYHSGQWRVTLTGITYIQDLTINPPSTVNLDRAYASRGEAVRLVVNPISRPEATPDEVYTLEMTWNSSFYFLGHRLPVRPGFRMLPFPFMPIKQLRVNITTDGTLATLKERPIQYENWTVTLWHGVPVRIPLGLADPQMDFLGNDTLVFQVKFPRLDIDNQTVVVWWKDDLDTQPAAYPTQIRYIEDATHKDVWHPLYDVEFVDLDHTTSRGYVDYYGVAAFVLRDPVTDYAFGPFNIHAFGVCGSSLGKYRPYGTWDVYYHYMRYSYIRAPIRIFAVLNTEKVNSVYSSCYYSGGLSNYYATLSIVQIINGTRYIPVTTYVYWKRSHTDKGYWMYSAMGRGIADWFAYIDLSNSTGDTPFPWTSYPPVVEEENPNFFTAYWNNVMGRAAIIDRASVTRLYNIGVEPMFEVTMFAPGGTPQGSIEMLYNPIDYYSTVYAGTLAVYNGVFMDFRLSGQGWLNTTDIEDGWENGYIYAPMFLEDYLPEIGPP